MLKGIYSYFVNKPPSRKGIPHTEEAKRKLSLKLKGRTSYWLVGKPFSLEHKRKISLGQKERYKDPKEREKTSLAMKGRKFSEEHRKNISERMKREWREGKRKPPMLGKHRSEETRRKLSQIQKGKRLSEETKQKLREANRGPRHPNWGKHLSEETKNKIRSTKIRLYKDNPELKAIISNLVKKLWENSEYREKHLGSKNPNWKGGLIKREETLAHKLRAELRTWANKILERDNYTCQRCGLRTKEKGIMEIHHIEPISRYPSLVLDVTNGITFCKYCHRKTESYGRKLGKKTPKFLHMNESIKWE